MSSKTSYIQQKVIEHFNLNPDNHTSKGWIVGGECPWCGQSDKFGIKLNQKTKEYRNQISFNCFHGSCGQRGSEYALLTKIGKEHLIKHGDFISEDNKVENAITVKDEPKLETESPTVARPFGFREVEFDEYLDSRGFEYWQYIAYGIGRTKLDRKLVNYVLFSIVENGEFKGYVGRIVWSKEQIKHYETTSGLSVSKYKNEGGVDFAKLLFGIDEITKDTKYVILVEGVTDKTNVDRQLNLNLCPDVKCVCTFGKKISEEQITKLVNKGVKNVTLLYDPDAINSSKKHSSLLELWGMKVKVGYLSDKDPGELTYDELIAVLQQTQSVTQFSIDRVQKQKLS